MARDPRRSSSAAPRTARWSRATWSASASTACGAPRRAAAPRRDARSWRWCDAGATSWSFPTGRGGRPAEPRRGHGGGRETGGPLMYALYTAASLVALVLVYAPAAVVRRLIRGVPLNMRARLGLGGAPRRRGVRAGWLHAVSVGEAITAAPLIEGLRRRCPARRLVVP